MKKILSVFMIAVMLFSVAFASNVYAAKATDVEVPVFSVSQQEASNGFIKLCFSLESGSLNSLDIKFEASQGLSCYSIEKTAACTSGGFASTNVAPENKAFNFSFVSTDGYSAKGPLFYVTYQVTDSDLNSYSVAFRIGDCTVTQTVNGKVENVPVNPADPVFSRNNLEIGLIASPFKKEYCVGQALDTKGLSVYALSLYGKKEVITGYSLSYDFNSAGQKKVTVCYLPNKFYAETTFEVTVKDHIPGELVKTKDPTCTQPGLKEATCTVCGGVCLQQEISANGHTAGEYKTVKEPTCSETGLKEARCTVCSEVCGSKEIAVKSHTLKTEVSKLPTYKTTGEKVTKCSVCGHVTKTVSVDKLSSDIDGDKKTTAKDALIILQHATGLKNLTGTALANADLNGSGSVLSDDALLVLQLATGLISA